MTAVLNYDTAPVPVRADLVAAHQRAWARLARAGTWLRAEERIAVAQEVRATADCRLCQARLQALSPSHVNGIHDSVTTLPESWVEAIHAIVSDPGRLRESWYQKLRQAGLAEAHYVEIVGVILVVVAIDSFARGIGMPAPDLPQPVAGTPSRYRPSSARRQGHWVATIDPQEAGEAEADLYAGTNGANIYRALSLVPDEARQFQDLDDHQYMTAQQMFDFTHKPRALSHAQMEFIAGRVSALNRCIY